jgi:hypothetical protein
MVGTATLASLRCRIRRFARCRRRPSSGGLPAQSRRGDKAIFSLRTIVLALLIAALAAAPAQASRQQGLTFEAPRDLLDPAARDDALAQLASLGVHSLRVVLYWHGVAPAADSRTRPAFDATDPGAYNWGQYAPLLEAAAQRHWSVLLTVSGPVPRWATEGARNTVTRPRPKEFRQFMTAVARRFAGQVALWSIWNEPNHPQFLGPQYDSHHRPVSPRVYRGLLLAAQRGLAAGGQGSVPLLMGETAPRGTGKDVAPLAFLRGVLCLDRHYHRVGHCRPLDVDGYAHHAYTTRAGPLFRPRQSDDVTIGVVGRLVRALDRAARARAIPAHLPIHLTEFGIQSVPDPYYGVSYLRQNEYRGIAERLAYDNPRVASFSQYLLRDDQPRRGVPSSQRYGGFESGLVTAEGTRKPAYEGFRLPLVARRTGDRVSLWGLLRSGQGGQAVTVEVSDGGRAFHKLATVTTNSRGYWLRRALFRKGRRWRVRWTAPDGHLYSSPPVRAYRW